MANFKSGYVALIGRPNVGKSTLLNAISGMDLAAVSAKPQTTRHKITGIISRPDAQVIFLDTPGFHHSEKQLNRMLLEKVDAAFEEADVICLMVEAARSDMDEELFERAGAKKTIVVVNKSDKIEASEYSRIAKYWNESLGAKEVFIVSALKRDGVDELLNAIIERLPEGQPFFDDDAATTLPVKFISAEHVRQEIFDQMHEEIPYSCAVVIDKFDESVMPIRISASIIVERESQKGMIIGKGGRRIKQIGIKSRKRIEDIVGARVHLELFVKVEKDWTKDPKLLKEYMDI